MARRRSALQDISTTAYTMRVSDTDSNLIFLHEQLTASPEEQIIQQRSQCSLVTAAAMEVSLMEKVDADVVLRRTPAKNDSFSKHVRKRLLMSPHKGKEKTSSPKAKTKATPPRKPCLLRRLSTPINLKEDLKPYTSEELVNVMDKLVGFNPALEQIDASVLGKDAKTMVRKTGRRKRKEEEEEETEEEKARKAAQKEQYDKWGKGLKQQEIENRNVEEALHEISKPLARGKDDADLDRHLRDQDRAGDPMLAFIKKKDKPSAKKGKIMVMPRYKGPPPPPNRFELFPGYRWDGVDRANGFEKKYFVSK